ncbi:MAG: tRNA uridine-5-carboxymethylaminomethyl(34) synthesis GTPase MnmE, partial [Oscillospiraceae bacterium]|nr:tRNA uridine-5-carboxymethylaminomethyl(34) synthesis GTPase MnmE [Oscillospiraceae bacterium]
MIASGDTIAAIATGAGVSAIGIIRLSGPRAIEIADGAFRAFGGTKMAQAPDRKLCYGELVTRAGVVDICLCTVSRAPNSYTGEDTAEFQCHGSPTVLAEGLRAVFALGARQARAGEFTKRAFLGGHMDLTQAEAVADIIEAQSAEAARNAAGQLAGAIRTKIEGIYESLLDVIVHFFAVIDYPDEEIDAFETEEYLKLLAETTEELRRMQATYERGSVVRDGVSSAIIGLPNVGKSSLLNALVGFDRAIVADTAGTTRDTIDEKLNIGGVLLRLTDTAGIRAAHDSAESQGVARARAAAAAADLVIAVFDGSRPLTVHDEEVVALAAGARHSIAAINKSDLPPAFGASALGASFEAVISLSARTGAGIDSFVRAVSAIYPAGSPSSAAGELITNGRHHEAIGRALESMGSAREALAAGITPDAALSELEA